MSFHILGTGKERYRQIRDLLYIAMRTDNIFIGAQRFFFYSHCCQIVYSSLLKENYTQVKQTSY